MIDLRSDTVTRPSPAMRAAMAAADVGDDVYGEDPTVNRLQHVVAQLLGKEAALFVPSGVMANQIALKCQTEPGDEVIVEEKAHIFNYETAGAAFLSNVQIRPVRGVRGSFTVEDIIPAIRQSVYYNPRTSLVCLENTHNSAGGTVFPLEEMKRMKAYAGDHGLKVHLDGARLWNAAIASGIAVAAWAQCADTVSVCFSKGLGAPVGSALAGDKAVIERARTVRKIFGGGMRQAGILAAGALYALDHNIARLQEDHAKARAFAERLAGTRGVGLDMGSVQTNIVILDVANTGKRAADVLATARERGVLLSDMGIFSVRAVTHMDVTMEETLAAAEVLGAALAM